MIEIPSFIYDAIQRGISVTIERDDTYGIRFDMNLMAKSHMHIVKENGVWYALMRYDEKFEVESVNDLKRLAKHGMHGRDFISEAWDEFIMSDEKREVRQQAYNALSKLTPEEQRAVQEFLK